MKPSTTNAAEIVAEIESEIFAKIAEIAEIKAEILEKIAESEVEIAEIETEIEERKSEIANIKAVEKVALLLKQEPKLFKLLLSKVAVR